MSIFPEDQDLIVLHEFTENLFGAPHQIKRMGITLCTEGECCFEVNGKPYTLHKGEILAVASYSVGRMVSVSSDCKVSLVAITPRKLLTFCLLKASELAKYVTFEPVIAIDDETMALLLHLVDSLRLDEKDNPIVQDLNISLLSSIFFTVLLKFQEKLRLTDYTTFNKEQMFATFLSELQAGCMQHREVGYYADLFCMTSKSFGQYVKDTTGETASVWIQRVTINQIKSYLRTPHYTVKEVADLYNFASTSNFYDYFKKHSSMTISEFREQSGWK